MAAVPLLALSERDSHRSSLANYCSYALINVSLKSAVALEININGLHNIYMRRYNNNNNSNNIVESFAAPLFEQVVS